MAGATDYFFFSFLFARAERCVLVYFVCGACNKFVLRWPKRDTYNTIDVLDSSATTVVDHLTTCVLLFAGGGGGS